MILVNPGRSFVPVFGTGAFWIEAGQKLHNVPDATVRARLREDLDFVCEGETWTACVAFSSGRMVIMPRRPFLDPLPRPQMEKMIDVATMANRDLHHGGHWVMAFSSDGYLSALWRDHDGDHRAGGGVEADDQLPRGAGERVHDHRQDRRVQACRRTEACELRVGDGHRDGHRRHREASLQVVRPVRCAVGEQGLQSGQHTIQMGKGWHAGSLVWRWAHVGASGTGAPRLYWKAGAWRIRRRALDAGSCP